MKLFAELSKREEEMTILYCDGLEKKEIADKLFVSPNTVQNTLRKVFEKLHIHNCRELMKLVYARGAGVQYDVIRQVIAVFFLAIVSLSFFEDGNSEFRRGRRTSRVTRTVRARARRGGDLC